MTPTGPDSAASDVTARPAALEHVQQRATPPSAAHSFSPLVSWITATTRPALLVELGPGDEASLRSTFGTARRSDANTTCVAVLLEVEAAGEQHDLRNLAARLSGSFDLTVEAYDSEAACLAALPAQSVEFLHVSLFDLDDTKPPDFSAWTASLAPGAVLVVTTTTSDASVLFAEAKRRLTEAYPAVSVWLGLTTEAIVAQVPVDGDTPVVDMLRRAPSGVGALVALLGEQAELQDLLTVDPEPSEAVRAVIGRVIDRQPAERETLLAAVQAYQDEADRLQGELQAARSELAQQRDAAREEREHLVAEFLDRVDELAAKVSTTAARYSAELADTNALLEAEGRKAETYAGQAAVAQSVLEDMRSSTSWRITAPVRVLSRLLARKAQPPSAPEHQRERRLGR
jgi:hypothetical protein